MNKVVRNQIKSDEDIEIAEYVMRYLYCNEDGAETSKMSAKYLSQDYLFNGDEHVFPGGFS